MALTLLEWAALAVYHARTRRRIAGLSLAGNILAGLCLLLAIRFALTGQPWWLVAAGLLGSLLAHLWDLRQRWR